MKKIFYDLNKLIENNSSGFSPNVNAILLYGPRIKENISIDNYELLKNREKITADIYETCIIPKLHLITNSLTSGCLKISRDKNKINSIIKIRSFEYIRSKIFSAYNDQFEISNETYEAISSNKRLNRNDYIKFGVLSNYLISHRLKSSKNIELKINSIYKSLIEKKENNFLVEDYLSFILNITKNSYQYWQNYSYFNKVYKKLNDLMLSDIFGIKIVDFNQEKFENRINELILLDKNFTIPGFEMIKERFDNHIERLRFKRPGGLHYNLFDIGLRDFPIEIQFQGIKSFIYDKYGPNAHSLYTIRNKKEQFKK